MVVVRGIVHHRVAGHGASHEAEWAALLHALDVAAALGERDVVLIGDAADVVAQANGAKCRSPDLMDTFKKHVATFDRVRVRHVRRGQNLAGIALEALAAGSGTKTIP